jgi:hypothetical protein
VKLPVKDALLPPSEAVPTTPQKRDLSPTRKGISKETSTPSAPRHQPVKKVIVKLARCPLLRNGRGVGDPEVRQEDKYHLRQLANPCDENARFVAIVIQGEDCDRVTEIHFGHIMEVYLADAGFDAIAYHDCAIEKTEEEKKLETIEQDEGRRFRSKWLTFWLLKSNRDIAKAALALGKYLECKVKIKDEVYEALGASSSVKGRDLPS